MNSPLAAYQDEKFTHPKTNVLPIPIQRGEKPLKARQSLPIGGGGEEHLVGVLPHKPLDDVDLLDESPQGVLVLPVARHVRRPEL